MRRFSRKRRRSGRRRTVGGKIIPDAVRHALGMSISSVNKYALNKKLNSNQKPYSLEKEASPEEEKKALEKAMAQNTIMQPYDTESPEKETTAQNYIEPKEESLFPPPPDMRGISPITDKGEKNNDFIAGLIFHGFDEAKIENLEIPDLQLIADILQTSNNVNLDDRVKKIIHAKIIELSNSKIKSMIVPNVHERRLKQKQTLHKPPPLAGGKKTRRRPRKRR